MIFAILFEDNNAYADKRAEFMADHLAFLETNKKHIQVAGPMKDAKDGTPAGGLWIVEADDVSQAQSLVEEDPFWPTGLRKSIQILEWTQVFKA